MKEAWIEMSLEDTDKIWDLFNEKFQFNPSVRAINFPSILEHSPSKTYKISRNYNQTYLEDLETKVLLALRSCTPLDDMICVLDWQHQCYWFNPHANFEKWEIPVLPDGDYYIFLAKNLQFGIFGHPWEWTQCIWGENLLSFFDKSKPWIWNKMIRQK